MTAFTTDQRPHSNRGDFHHTDCTPKVNKKEPSPKVMMGSKELTNQTLAMLTLVSSEPNRAEIDQILVFRGKGQ